MGSIIVKRGLGAVALFLGVVLIGWLIYNVFAPTREFKSNYRTVFQLVLPIVLVVTGWKWIRDEGAGIEQTPIDFKCRELEESVGRAKATLPYFLEQVGKNVDGAYIKFPLKTPAGITEHIWAYVHSFRDGVFNVSLANVPYDTSQSSDGRRDVSSEEVEDWQITYPDGRIKGGFSLIALFENYESQGKKLTPKMKKQKAQLIDADEAVEHQSSITRSR